VNKLVVVLSALAATLGTPALAADMPLKAPPPVWSWAGWYVGGNLGGTWAHASDTVNFAPAAAAGPAGASLGLPALNAGTFMGGAQVGYNWQVGHVVYGLEASADGHNWNASQTLTAFALGTLFVPGDTFSVQSNWHANFLGRLGYAWGPTLLYATGGLALTGVNVSSSLVVFGRDPATAGSSYQTVAGGTLGAGIEYAFAQKWSAGLEGRYTWYGTPTFNTGVVSLGFPVVFDPVTQNVGLNTGEVLAKINYHF
jgi:outer membrane immunogenic protein